MTEPKTTSIAPSRIRTIMKSTEDTEKISTEGLHLMTKATEMFIQYLAKNSYSFNSLKYDHLSQLVNKKDNLEFLLQIIPQKISVRDFKEIISKGDKDSDESCSDEESDDSVPQKKDDKTKLRLK